MRKKGETEMSKTYKIHGHKCRGKLRVKPWSVRSKAKVKLKKSPDEEDVVFPDVKSSNSWRKSDIGWLCFSPIVSETEFLRKILSVREGLINEENYCGLVDYLWKGYFIRWKGMENLSEISVQKVKDDVHRYYVRKGGLKMAQYSISKRRSRR
jgi:hypothetical protein